MAAATPWSDPETLAGLSRRKVGRDLARRVVARLVERDGRYGVYNTHRDYCGHGLVFQAGRFRLVEVHDGYARDGRTLMSWDDQDSFIDWLARQTDFSLSGADPSKPELHTSDPFKLNNQRLTREQLLTYLHGGPALVGFLDYLEGMDQAFRFLVDDYGFSRLSPTMAGRECVVSYRRRPHAGLTVMSEFLTMPHITASKSDTGENDGFSNRPLHLLARKRAPGWKLPVWKRGEVADYRTFFDDYAVLLKTHFPDLLGDSQQVGEDEERWQPEQVRRQSKTAWRLCGLAISVSALLLMNAELRYFIVHDTPPPTGSVRANIGLMLLMSIPWVVLVFGLLQTALGVGVRDMNTAFTSLPMLKRILMGASVVALSIALTAIPVAFT